MQVLQNAKEFLFRNYKNVLLLMFFILSAISISIGIMFYQKNQETQDTLSQMILEHQALEQKYESISGKEDDTILYAEAMKGGILGSVDIITRFNEVLLSYDNLVLEKCQFTDEDADSFYYEYGIIKATYEEITKDYTNLADWITEDL